MTSFTKLAIKQAFMKLLNEKPVSKITVREIAEECGINRNSFYYHYSDIPSLIEEIFFEEADKLMSPPEDGTTIYDTILTAIDFALQNKRAMLHIYNSANHLAFEQYLNRLAERTVSNFTEIYPAARAISPSDRDVIIMYYKSLLIGFVTDWLSGGMKYDLTEHIKRICELFEGTIDTAITRAEHM